MGQQEEFERSISERNLAIDALRGLAVLLMVQQHLGVWLVDRFAQPVAAGYVLLNLTGGAAAPLFLFISGYSSSLGRIKTVKSQWVRAFAILGLGVTLNLLTPSWFSIGSFYVLHLIAIWLFLVPLLRKCSVRTLLIFALASGTMAVLLQWHLHTPMVLRNPDLRNMNKAGGAFRLAIVEGHFPIFPWMMIPLFGMTTEKIISRTSDSKAAILGGILTFISALFFSSRWLMPNEMLRLPWRSINRIQFYPASLCFMLALSSLCIFLLLAFEYLKKRKKEVFLNWLVPFGRTSLSLLFLHIVLFREISAHLGFKKVFSPAQGLVIIIAFCAIWGLFAASWSKRQYRFGLEWLVRKLAR